MATEVDAGRRWRAPIRRMLTEAPPVLRLSVPIVAGLVASTLPGLVETFMLGPLGAVPLAAASLTASVVLMALTMLYGFLGPVSLLAAHARGAGDVSRIAEVVRHGLVLALLASIATAGALMALLAALPLLDQPTEVLKVLTPYWVLMTLGLVPTAIVLVYKLALDAIDRAWTGVVLMLVPSLLVVPLNAIFIYGYGAVPPLGLTGAGIAGLLAQCIGLVVTVLYCHSRPRLAPYLARTPWRRDAFRAHLREGYPMAIQYLLEGGSVAVLGFVIGWLGATALAANQIVSSVANAIYMLPLGMSGAVSIRIAQAIGQGSRQRIGAIGAAAVGLVTLWSVTFTLFLIFAGADVARLFVDDPAVVQATAAMFVSVGLMQVFDGVQSVSLGALRGLLDNRWPARTSLIAYWLVALPLGYVFGIPCGWGGAGVWAGFALGIALAAVLLLARFVRLARLAAPTP